MNNFSFLLIITAISLLSFSCQNKGDSDKNSVTKRIQYDVMLRNPEADPDWWVQNIEGSDREKLVKDILSRVSEGVVKAYDFHTNRPLSVEEVRKIMKRVDTISLERAVPPYDLVDTVLVTEIRLSDITKLRFLEEWKMDEKTLDFSKQVLGICPLIEKYSDSGELRGYKPLFWVFFNDRYPAELETK